MTKSIFDLLNSKYWSGVDYDYDRTSCTGQCDDYCRCTQITSVDIKSIDLNAVCNDICTHLDLKKNNIIDRYVVDRLLAKHMLYDCSKWTYQICNGYYGEEVDRVYPEPDVLKQILADINIALKLESDTEKINFLLIAEYGHLLDCLEDKIYTLDTVSKKDLIKQSEYYKKVNLVESYKDYNLPRGIIIQQGPNYRLIDGYHRVFASSEDNVLVWKTNP